VLGAGQAHEKLFILVEGQTEETFVREILAFHLNTFGLASAPVLLKTKRTKSGTTFKGGFTSYVRARNDILALLQDSSSVAVTTMVDFYGLPADFPGRATCPPGSASTRVHYLQQRWSEDINHARFLPFLLLHEFEALLFADTGAIAKALPDYSVAAPLMAVRQQVGSPEEIDEGPQTHPSAHILRHAPAYQTTVDGPLIALEIGLAAIRNQCPHFDAWVTSLEQLADL
jgi:hypothetical protein